MSTAELGKHYTDGQTIFREGEVGNRMYVVQHGRVRILKNGDAGDQLIAILGPGDFLGEMALFDRHTRSATAVVEGEAQILTVDKRKLYSTIDHDPTLAFHIIESLCGRVRRLNEEVSRLKTVQQE